MALKICNCCHVEKDRSNFNLRSKSVDGLQHKCKLCSKAYNRVLRNRRVRPRINYCSSCEEFLPLRLMHKTGRYSICKYHHMLREIVNSNLSCFNILTKESCFFLLMQSCVLCDSRTKLKLKREDQHRSYTHNNVAELCGRCYKMSESYSTIEFLQIVSKIYNRIRVNVYHSKEPCCLCGSEDNYSTSIYIVCRKCEEKHFKNMSIQCLRYRMLRIHRKWREQMGA